MTLVPESWVARSASVQGASYIGFAVWSLLGRGHYRRTHSLGRTDAWVLNAHGMWMLLVGSVLALAANRGHTDEAELRVLGLGSAVGLAINDAVAAPAPIYRSDLIFESAIAAAWLVACRADAASRPRLD